MDSSSSVDDIDLGSTNALDHFHVFKEFLTSKQLVILLDYDGTLTPIVNDPSKALITHEVRATLRKLSKHFVTGIVTGRSLAKIRNFVSVPGLFYAGSHGFDILAPHMETDSDEHKIEEGVVRASCVLSCEHEKVDSTADLQAYDLTESLKDIDEFGTRYQVAGEFIAKLQDIKHEVEEAIKDIPGAAVEDNIYSISVHYRNCPRKYVPIVRDIVLNTKAAHNDIRYRGGKEVYELQPDVQWNKGCAVVYMLEMLGLSRTPCVEGNEDEVEDEKVVNENSSSDTTATTTTEVTSEMKENHDNSILKSEMMISSKIFTIFIGDDKTDEDAFRVFREDFENQLQQPGFGILVSDIPKPTNALFTLKDPSEVHELLRRLSDIGSANDIKPTYFCQKRAAKVLKRPLMMQSQVNGINKIVDPVSV